MTTWTGRLETLFLDLMATAKTKPVSREQVAAGKGWAARQMTDGTLVAMRRRPDLGGEDRMELRVARVSVMDEGEWSLLIRTIMEKFQIREANGDTPAIMPSSHWMKVPKPEDDEAPQVVRYVSLMTGEIEPGKARCWQCLQDGERNEIEWLPGRGARYQLCYEHRLAQKLADRERSRAEDQGTLL